MKININNIDLDDLEDLPDREKLKSRPKRRLKIDPKVNEKKDLEEEDDSVLLRQ